MFSKKIILLFSLLILAVVSSAQAQGKKPETITLDVRTPAEFEERRLKGAQNIDFLKDDFRERVSKLDKKSAYKVYCRSGNRSGKALKVMKELGFTNVENVGSLEQAKEKLNATCEGAKPC